MEIGDLVLDPDMKRCIVFARSRKPSRIVQVSRFGEVVESEWVKVVCVRSGSICVVPVRLCLGLKSCGRSDYVQALENLSDDDRGVLDFLKVRFGDYEFHKRDAASIFIR
jgi:hypothetical protein